MSGLEELKKFIEIKGMEGATDTPKKIKAIHELKEALMSKQPNNSRIEQICHAYDEFLTDLEFDIKKKYNEFIKKNF